MESIDPNKTYREYSWTSSFNGNAWEAFSPDLGLTAYGANPAELHADMEKKYKEALKLNTDLE